MVDVSVLIPARGEQYLNKTVQDLLNKARGDLEIIVTLDGWQPDSVVSAPNVHYIRYSQARGMRGAINAAAAMATGRFLMKCDAHCMFDEGFDVKLAAVCQPDWVLVPRRESLDPEKWECRQKKHIDHLFLCYPDDPGDFGGPTLTGKFWPERNNDVELAKIMVDDLMSAQGSCYFLHKDYFHWLELLDETNYGHFSKEFQEVGLKCWLSGGQVKRVKNTWYAHWHKGGAGRGWPLGKSVLDQGGRFTNKWMDGRNWHKQDRDIRWLVNRFWPVPTWPEESVRLVFHTWRGGSGVVRGGQVARHFKARIDPREDWHYDFDVNVWVKGEPKRMDWPGKHYLDVMDAPERIPWLQAHPECGVIATSLSGYERLKEILGREDVYWIPIHHCNFGRAKRERTEFKVAGVVGGPGAIQCDPEALRELLHKLGLEFRWYQDYKGPEDIVEFYKGLDVQIVWRTMRRPLKDPEKITNAMSLGVPTVAWPEPAYKEVEGHYWRASTFDELAARIDELRQGWDAEALIRKGEEYHIDNIAKLYGKLL